MSLIRVKAFHYEGKEMKALDDNRIVDLYLSRDETAIAHTSEKYGSRLRNVAYGIVEDLHTAEECENDTYMEAWNSIPPHEPKSYLFAFLARITRHIALDFCKERSRLKRSAFISELSAEMEQCIPAPDDTERRIGGMVLRRKKERKVTWTLVFREKRKEDKRVLLLEEKKEEKL